MLEIRKERFSEYRKTENVVREAFWNVYSPGCDDHYLVHQIRKSPAFIPELSLIALDNGKIIGYVTNLKSYIEGDDGNRYEVLSLGPIAVLPEYQRIGIGTRLISEVKEIAHKLDYRAILLCGNPAFYTKRGFESAEKYGIRNSENMFAAVLHVCGLYDGALQGISGRYYEDCVYNVSEEAVREFDKNFPQKTPISGTPSQQYFLEMVNNCWPYDEK